MLFDLEILNKLIVCRHIGFLVLLLGITSSTALKTMKCIPWHSNTYCSVKNENYHDENEAIEFNTDNYTISDHDFTIFDTANGNNNFSVFPNSIFEKFPYMTMIMFVDAQLKTLSKKSFSNCLGLLDLRLEKNLIQHLEAGVFEQCENILSLYLMSNKISSIDKDAFRNLWSLHTLDLFNNSITTLHQDTFNNIPNLLQLVLKNNQITQLHNDTFKQLKAMFYLDLSYNKIVTIESALFNVPGLTVLKLGHNRINAIQPNFFEYWPPNNTYTVDIALEYNFCIKKDFIKIRSPNLTLESVKPEFAQCFKNYMRPKLTPNV